jgi:hypothetical protein
LIIHVHVNVNVITWFPFIQQQQLNQIQSWTEQVSNVIKTFSTANGLLYVDCHVVQNVIVPKLNNIFKQMVKMVAFQVLFLSKEVITEMEILSEVTNKIG